MSKKIKILLTILAAIILTLLLSNSVFAWSPSYTSPLFPQFEGSDTIYFCKEKGGPVRFTPSEYANVNLEDWSSKYTFLRHESLTNLRKVGQAESDGVMSQAIDRMVRDIAEDFKPVPVFVGELINYNDIINHRRLDETVIIEHTIATTPVYVRSYEMNYSNNKISYILTAGASGSPNSQSKDGTEANKYNLGNHEVSVSDSIAENDDKYKIMQYALWNDGEEHTPNEYNEGYSYRIENSPENSYADLGNKLYDESVKYEEFYNEFLKDKNYKNFISLNDSSAKVIVNQTAQAYIIGPYTVSYPDKLKFSYIENIEIITNKNKIIKPTKVITRDSFENYPGKGEQFFLEFPANQINHDDGETNVKIKVSFAYLNETSAKIEVMSGTGSIYEFYNAGIHEKVTETWPFFKWITHEQTVVDENNNPVVDENGNFITEVIRVPEYYYDVYGEIKTRYVGYYDAQRLALFRKITIDLNGVGTNATKKWQGESLESHELDLTIELGGLVWEEDVTADKNNGKADGYYTPEDSLKLMSNVLVKLYDSNGRYIDSTITSAQVIRSNPNYNYVFTGLDAMKKYYVEFTYNGQYYEPTYYRYDDLDNWETTSKGADIRLKRTNYNEQFETIYDYTGNYKMNEEPRETFTREDLMGHVLKIVNDKGVYVSSDSTYAVIDEFGNLLYDRRGNPGVRKSNDENGTIIELSSLSESVVKENQLVEKIRFIQDCQTQSYTLNPNSNKNKNATVVVEPDLYPKLDVFVISQYGLQSTIPYIEALYVTYDGIGGEIKPLYSMNVFGKKYSNYCINQGYVARQKVDLALQEEPLDVTTEINGVSHTYPYGKLNIAEDGVADITVRISDHYYDLTSYTREIRVEDYLYNVDNITDVNGKRLNELGKSKSDELEVYVRYVVYVQNKSTGGIRTRLDEVVNYYDNDYIFVPERSCGKIWSNTTSKFSSAYELNTRGMQEGTAYNTDEKIDDDYKNLYIKALKDENGQDIYLDEGDVACLYLTFKVAKDENGRIKLDETLDGTQIGVGKEIISEINGYTTKYKDGTDIPNVEEIKGNDTTAGLIDINSNPGNLSKYLNIKKDQENTDFTTKFENDTDKATPIRIKIKRDDSRTIFGVVREDDRTNSNGVISIGDGVLGNNEQLIDGVTVQLVELTPVRDENGNAVFDESGNAKFQEIIWKEVSSGSADATPMINENNLVKDYDFEGNTKGAYAFKSFVPGKYIVRFKYGDTTKTVLTNVEGSAVNTAIGEKGLNEKSYNGQDYKSTIYQKDVSTSSSIIWRDKSTWNRNVETLGKELKTIRAFNKETADQNDTLEYLYDIVASDQYSDISDAKDIAGRRAKVNSYSSDIKNHIAEVLESYEKMPQDSSANVKAFVDELIERTYMIAETGLIPVDFEYAGSTEGRYAIKDLNLGLQERPKAQLTVNKDITNVKVTLADGSILFDAKNSATNVLWRKPQTTNFNNLYNDNKLKQNEIEALRNANAYGLVQLTMDQEIMHGATLEITYNVTVTNVGEVDYNDYKFYYTGVVGNANSVVKTSAKQVVDYVANNLQFDKSRNSDWDVISKDTLVTDDVNSTLVNKSLKDNVSKYNTVIVTKSLNKDLVPTIYKKLETGSENSVTVPLVLTQVITSENKSDDLTYNNTVEIVETRNIVGRKNAYSIVGNQDPTVDPQEVDADKAEQVKILPPFGNGGMNYIIAITLVSAVAILVGGIIFIRKKVLKK